MIVIASDHAALKEKTAIVNLLKNKGLQFKDLGPVDTTPCDYPDFAVKAAKEVASGKAKLGILICGTGIGMSIAANKIKGIRCALISDTFSAKATRQHNNSNMLAVGARVLGEGLMLEVVDAFISTDFSNEPRHQARIDKITALEK